MNMDLMTIDNMMFAAAAVAPPPANKPNTFTNGTNFSPPIDNIQPYSNTPESTTADNIPAVTQNKPINKPRESFNQTLRKTVNVDSPQKNQNNKEPDKDELVSAIPSGEDSAQFFPATEIPLTFGLLVKENATKTEPKTAQQLAQMITNLKDGKSSPVTGQATKSAENKLLVNTEKGQLGLKTVLPETSKGQTGLKSSVQSTSKDQPTLQTVLTNISEATSTADTQPGEGINTDKISASNGTALTTKAINNKENVKELMFDPLAGANHKTTEINEKTHHVDASVVADSTKSSDLNGKKSGLDNLVEHGDKNTEKDTTLTDKSAIHANEKTADVKINFSQVQNKIIEPKSQPVGIAPEISTTALNTTTDSKRTNSEILSESSDGNSKEFSQAGSKLPDNSAVQKLNISAVQVSTGQTKNNNSAASNNNHNSELKQIITHNNIEAAATELPPNSAEGTKTVELPSQTSPNTISTGVGQQIQESVRSSFSQQGQNQQITIQLNPPELGKVLIKFQEQDNQITGLLEVSKTQTRIEIEQAIPQIIRGLQDSGIQIKRLDVVLSQGGQPDQGALRDSASGGLQNGWAQQQYPTDSYTGRNSLNASEINEWLTNNNSDKNISQLEEALTTDLSINMLI
ncbi:MAG: flagellar hook-length control protein FliK [Planctomycetes bacterium]|nr:flagellar hook-length control protein FliK [Planctomycetota bacterium]MBL7144776.1 flagellar hook-length control protein FliK [Phycisphaerae bacterium]